MTTLADLERVERKLREQAQSAIAYNETVLLPGHYVFEAADTIAAFVREQREREWQPIETAPRDIGRVIVLDPNIGFMVASQGWANATPNLISWEVINDVVVHPTHWMPLPAAPSGTKENSDG